MKRAGELYEAILGLSVAVEQRAQATLAYAQSALRAGDVELAEAQLERARDLIAECSPETGRELGKVITQLIRDTTDLRGGRRG